MRYQTALISEIDGGEGRDRTDYLLLAKQLLSQMSYIPKIMVPQVRIELTTYRLQGECSTSELQGRNISNCDLTLSPLAIEQPTFLKSSRN